MTSEKKTLLCKIETSVYGELELCQSVLGMMFKYFIGGILQIMLGEDLIAENRILGMSVARIFARTLKALSKIHYPSDRSPTTIT